MDGVWSPFHFIIVVDALPIAARVLEAFAAHVDEQVIAGGMLQADWSGALRCMALLSSHRGSSPPSTSRYWPLLHKLFDSRLHGSFIYWQLRYLLDDGHIDLELKDDSGTTALAKAVNRELTFEARHLLSAGANPMASWGLIEQIGAR